MSDDDAPADRAAREAERVDEGLAEIRERALAIRAELDRWETGEDAAEEVSLADVVEDLEKWETGEDAGER